MVLVRFEKMELTEASATANSTYECESLRPIRINKIVRGLPPVLSIVVRLLVNVMAKLPEFKHTDVNAIPGLSKEVRQSFLSYKTRPLEWRLTQLRKLYWGYVNL